MVIRWQSSRGAVKRRKERVQIISRDALSFPLNSARNRKHLLFSCSSCSLYQIVHSYIPLRLYNQWFTIIEYLYMPFRYAARRFHPASIFSMDQNPSPSRVSPQPSPSRPSITLRQRRHIPTHTSVSPLSHNTIPFLLLDRLPPVQRGTRTGESQGEIACPCDVPRGFPSRRRARPELLRD